MGGSATIRSRRPRENAHHPFHLRRSSPRPTAKIISHFESYSSRRLSLARSDPPAFFCPYWCTTFENSFLRLGGCRPSLFIHLVGSGAGSSAGSEMMLEKILNEEEMKRLRMEVVKEEEVIDAKMAEMQEVLANKPLLVVTERHGERTEPTKGGEVDGNVDEEVRGAMEAYTVKLMGILEEADALRLRTLKRLATEVLKPRQTAELLRAGKQLHLSMHEWGLTRDRERSTS